MDEKLIENWNRKVKPKDEIYILGDFIFGNGDKANQLVKKLNGKKYLIKGNHDRFLKDKKFDYSLLEWVKDYYVIKQNKLPIILFHYPIARFDRQHYGAIHLYGHIHSRPNDLNITNAYNVGVDVNNYEPVSINEVLERVKENN
jgi:calcineurin-like phosphoesterase family protein